MRRSSGFAPARRSAPPGPAPLRCGRRVRSGRGLDRRRHRERRHRRSVRQRPRAGTPSSISVIAPLDAFPQIATSPVQADAGLEANMPTAAAIRPIPRIVKRRQDDESIAA
ncbi:unnamed protein product [Sordaria macrospora k-hell]|uniref:WGS project CABT00000000 data, contig 2.512 n=1 Tax=Sordaria macrospora (strain ATCC MYA-333 / DSM 997 / K(L3346) / K-hell) TaxID=771870 RepID=F7WD01_SORMK|nr:uncharacterized protein SMAC_10775 [Sordaria macrospora k-hell]CCC05763.1 unnamed protein product [Sordaria macrospora k-hell]